MSSRDSPRTLIAFAERNWDSIGGVVAGGLMGTFLAIYVQGINFIQAVTDVLIAPLEEMGVQLVNIVQAFQGGIAEIIEQGVETTVLSIAPGATWAVGPLTFTFSVVVVAAALYVMGWLLARGATSDIVPGSFTDAPGAGVDEEDEDVDSS